MIALLLLASLAAAVPARAASAVDSALERLHSEDIAVRERACADLARAPQRSPRVYIALSEAMDKDLSERVRLAAAEAVITFPGDASLRRAQNFLQSEPGERNRMALTAALSTEPAHIDDSGVTDLIASMLADDPSAEVRRAAALALAKRGDIRAIPAVRMASEKEADPSAREAARQALRVLSAPRRTARTKEWKPTPPKPGAVKGTDPCPAPWAWCECNGLIKRPPKCLSRKDCRIEVDTVIQLGMPCMWSELPIGTAHDE